MRLYPPVPVIQRVIQKDIEIDGKILPAGTTIDVGVYDLHHNPEIWPDHMVGRNSLFFSGVKEEGSHTTLLSTTGCFLSLVNPI